MIVLMLAAQAGNCTETTLAELSQTPAPAIFVLGERKGTMPDLGRASRLVSKLQANGEVTLALQAVDKDKQSVLDRFSKGEIDEGDLSGLLDWYGSWAFPYPPYVPLVTSSAKVVGIGVPVEMKPQDTPVQVPPGYISVLSDGMSGHYMPGTFESTFEQTVTWFDHRTAKAAVGAWSGEGYLVIVADRTHVEGGKGLSWQAKKMSDSPVTTVLLGGPGLCYDGDRYL